jgi:hypothetical protein
MQIRRGLRFLAITARGAYSAGVKCIWRNRFSEAKARHPNLIEPVCEKVKRFNCHHAMLHLGMSGFAWQFIWPIVALTGEVSEPGFLS